MKQHPSRFYTRALKPFLPPEIHEPATSRLGWLPVHLLVVTLGISALALGWVPLSLAWAVSLPLGVSFAGLTFLAHETLHGAVVRGRAWQNLVGTIGFLPFCISPRLWVAWHNRVHHGHAQHAVKDPDAFPTLDVYRGSKIVRIMIDVLGAKRGAPAGAFALLIGFSIQSLQMLVGAVRFGLLTKRQARLALLESVLGASVWLGVGLFLGWAPFVFGFVVPLMIANAVVMAHILTNHSLSPLTEINDPLINSLSVTVPGWVEWLTLGFGFHVEHHLYPWMSTRHGRAVRELICARWPERYQSMPLTRALRAIYASPRVYADATTLFDPISGQEWPTLAPRLVYDERTASAVSEPSFDAPPALASALPIASLRPSAAHLIPDGLSVKPASPH